MTHVSPQLRKEMREAIATLEKQHNFKVSVEGGLSSCSDKSYVSRNQMQSFTHSLHHVRVFNVLLFRVECTTGREKFPCEQNGRFEGSETTFPFSYAIYKKNDGTCTSHWHPGTDFC